MRKNDIIDLNIDSVSGDGSGIGKHEGQIVFVPFTAIGDTVRTLIIKVTKTYAVGKVLEILVASSSRKEPDCPHFTRCGGCMFRHITLEEEEKIKTETVASAMKRIGHLNVEVKNCITPKQLSYRNKAQLPVNEDENGLHCGFYAPHSHRIIDGSMNCITSPKIFANITKEILDFMKNEGISGYNEKTTSGIVRHLYFRENNKSEVMVCIVINAKQLVNKDTQARLCKALTDKFPQICSIFLNINTESTNVILGEKYIHLWGQEYFEDELLGTRLRMSPDSFFQVNREGAEAVYSTAFSLLDGKYENVYDLYCGIGSIGITLFNEIKKGNVKASAKRLFGIEIVEKASKCAKMNAELNCIDNARFKACDSVDITKMDWFDKFTPSLVILDPPRKGTTKELLDFLVERKVAEILYISCDPATLARDMAHLIEKGYTPSPVYPINLFSGTKHVESVCLLKQTAI